MIYAEGVYAQSKSAGIRECASSTTNHVRSVSLSGPEAF
jgi:hypothetical protein